MKISTRQEEILKSIIVEYIKTAEPVSSRSLEKKYKLKVCPATIRNEMQKLTEKGLISQPHTSAGRVPTDKGYRFFVDRLLARELLNEDFDQVIREQLESEIGKAEDLIKVLQVATRNLSAFSSGLALGYVAGMDLLWKDGWEEIIREPEFSERKVVSNFINLLENLEQELDVLEVSAGVKVYIGKENPFSSGKEFTTIVSKCYFPAKKEEGFLALIGPKRMDYDRNISLINFLVELLNK